MGKILILLNGAGLVLNVFVFLIVVAYFEEGESEDPTVAEEAISKSDFTKLASTVQRELQKLNSSSAQKLSSEFSKVLSELGRLKNQVSSLDAELKKLMTEPVEEPVEPAENGEAEGTEGGGSAAPAPEEGSPGAE